MLLTVSVVKAKEINQNAKASVSKSVKNKLDKKEKIFKFIKLVQPKYSTTYIKKIVDAIFKYSIKYKIDPYIITTTAYVESEFNMKSGPCVGIMQVYKPTLRWLDPKKEYDINTIDGNIGLGTKELSEHYNFRYLRGNQLDRSSNNFNALKIMWGKYNGSGPRSSYVSKTFNALRILSLKNIDDIERLLRTKPIWVK